MAVFTNQATVTYNGNVANSNITVGEIVDVLTVTKTAVDDTYRADGTVTYAISLVNSGAADLNALTLTDGLGAYAFGSGTVTPLTYVPGTLTYFVNGAEQTLAEPNAVDPLTLTGVRVPAGGNAMILYEAVPNRFAPFSQGGNINNTVTVSGAGLTEPLTAAAVVGAEEGAVLTISKSLAPAVVQENGQITYTFTIQNSGNAALTETDDAVLRDVFDPVLNITSVTYNGAPWSSPADYTYDQMTGAFASAAGALTVPAATFTQDAVTGEQTVTPGVSTLIITGTV